MIHRVTKLSFAVDVVWTKALYKHSLLVIPDLAASDSSDFEVNQIIALTFIGNIISDLVASDSNHQPRRIFSQ